MPTLKVSEADLESGADSAPAQDEIDLDPSRGDQ